MKSSFGETAWRAGDHFVTVRSCDLIRRFGIGLSRRSASRSAEPRGATLAREDQDESRARAAVRLAESSPKGTCNYTGCRSIPRVGNEFFTTGPARDTATTRKPIGTRGMPRAGTADPRHVRSVKSRGELSARLARELERRLKSFDSFSRPRTRSSPVAELAGTRADHSHKGTSGPRLGAVDGGEGPALERTLGEPDEATGRTPEETLHDPGFVLNISRRTRRPVHRVDAQRANTDLPRAPPADNGKGAREGHGLPGFYCFIQYYHFFFFFF